MGTVTADFSLTGERSYLFLEVQDIRYDALPDGTALTTIAGALVVKTGERRALVPGFTTVFEGHVVPEECCGEGCDAPAMIPLCAHPEG